MPPVPVAVERSKPGSNRIALAITIGTVLGCIFGVLFPRQYFLLSSSNSAAYRHHSTLISPIINFDSSLCALTDRVVLSKADYHKLQFPTSDNPRQLSKSSVTSQILTVDKSHRKLAKMLKRVAINKELIVSIIIDPIHQDILEIFFNGIKRVGITNFLPIVFDNATAELCRSNGVTFYHYTGNTDLEESRVRLKLNILRIVLELGYNIVYSDVDIIYLRNPFEILYRDSDVELMSNGDNTITAYGFSDDKEVKSMSIGFYNSGFFYLSSGVTTINLLDRVAKRVTETSFEVAFNEELFLPSCPGYLGLHVSKRIMKFDMFTNTNVVLEKDARTYNKAKAVIVKVSQMDEHKLPIMKALVDFYVNGKNDSLQPFSFSQYGFD